MDPTSGGPHDQQLSDQGHVESTDGHFSRQPPNKDDDQESLHRDAEDQPNELDNAEFDTKQETRLILFLIDLVEKAEKINSSTDDAISNRVSVSLNDAASETVFAAGETGVNTATNTAVATSITARVNYPDLNLPLDLKETLQKDVNIPALEPPHRTPLHIAIQIGLNEITRQLIDAGANIDALDDNYMQPLHVACDKGNQNLIKLLLDEGAMNRGPDNDGWCLLHCASYFEMDADLLDRLIEVDREYLNRKEHFEEWTPINRAAWFGRQSVVDALLKAGVDLGIADKNGWTPMMTAIVEKHFEIFDKMVEYLAHAGSKDVQAQKAVIDQRDDEGMTILMLLCVAQPTYASEASLRNFLQRLRPTANITDNIDKTALDHVMALAKTPDNPHAKTIALEVIKWWPEQTLLRQNVANETAFDDASGPLLDAMVNRLKSDFLLRDKLLCWLASKVERHATAIDILSNLRPREPIDALRYSIAWTLVDWAIYHRMPRVLLNSPAVSGSDTDHGTVIITQLREFHPSSEKKINTDRKDELTPRQVLDEMNDILNFLPYMRSEKPKRRWKFAQSSPEITNCLANYNAAVVRFRQRELEAFRFRNVNDVVYGHAPISLITISQIQHSDSGGEIATVSAKKDIAEAESTFTWVHLPATNMDWMKHTAMKIMKTQSEKDIGDQEKLASFLQASWVEIPDKTSASRFMRPRYVRMQPEGGQIPDETRTQNSNPRSSSVFPCPASALYMPFLVVSQYGEEKQSLDPHEASQRSSFSGAHSASQVEKSLERQQLFRVYKGSVLHDSPTLDEHYHHFTEGYGSSREREMRNVSQILTKYLTSDVRSLDMPRIILRVSQLWAWTIGDKWLITSTSCANVERANTFVADIREHLRQRADDGSLNGGLHSPQELSKVIAEYCIGAYERKRTFNIQLSEIIGHDQPDSRSAESRVDVGENLHHRAYTRVEERSIRQIFSDYINQIGLKESDLFDQFSTPFIFSGQKGTKSIASALGIGDALEDTRLAAGALYEIKDVRDELHILKSIAEHQRQVQASMDNALSSVSQAGSGDNMKAKYVKNDIEELDRLASNIQEALQTTLALYESEIANRHAKEAVNQGKRVIVFTVITVWFLPLSFLTSLFALDVESFLGAPWWSLVAIFTVPLPFLLVAIGYMYDWDIFVRAKDGAKQLSTKAKDGTKQLSSSLATKSMITASRTRGMGRRLTQRKEKYDDGDGNHFV